ncbi:uncharacterized protein J4E92_006547 [Alternaria infectoria]|uniref:uncharacterized protein n=1 Tax=Alternaria infectoria TaxID=45303 RepID=UPI00222005A7|nr:uncharacterized protein J4E92_006547 [Alternaria infectoria]KAI4925811.1 hypothetical protein J4E92_006547 [Alternaria infectoria]
MEHFVTPLPSAESEANRVEYQPTNIEAEANKQRRKVQNRKNQRAHLRDNLIRHEGLFDPWELLQDLIGELMGATPIQERRGMPLAIKVSDPKVVSKPPTAVVARDEDEVTAGRKGLVVWGEPHDMKSWEATPGFLAKWSWAVQGCDDLLVSSNRWRLMRGEEPLRLPLMED